MTTQMTSESGHFTVRTTGQAQDNLDINIYLTSLSTHKLETKLEIKLLPNKWGENVEGKVWESMIITMVYKQVHNYFLTYQREGLHQLSFK